MTEAAVQQLEETKRIRRSVLFIHQYKCRIANPLIRADVGGSIQTDWPRDVAARLNGRQK